VTKQARAQGDDLWKPHCLPTLFRLRRLRPAERPDLHLAPGPAPCARTSALRPNASATVVRRACAFSLWRAVGAPAVSEWLKCEAGFNSGTISSVYAELMKVTLEPFASHLRNPPSGDRVRRWRLAPESHQPRTPPLPFPLPLTLLYSIRR
jgi:hypothetical protein